MPTNVISMVTQLNQFIIVFSFKLKTFIGSRVGSLLTFNSPLAKPLKNKAKPQQSVSLFTCKNNFNNFGWVWWMWWVFVCRLIVSNVEIHVFMTSPFRCLERKRGSFEYYESFNTQNFPFYVQDI